MDALKTLKDLIAIPSINPMRANSGEAAERAATGYIESLLRHEQIDCERQAVADGRENLIALVHATTGRPTVGGLLLNSHIDTVPVANMAINPFDPVVKDGRIFGRGSCDAKASIAAMLAALAAIVVSSKNVTAQAAMGMMYELDAIAMAVIGTKVSRMPITRNRKSGFSFASPQQIP
mgnify:CR=1 FL=1